MNADLTTVVVAVLGVAGTLSSPLLGQRIAARAREQEFRLQRSARTEERNEAQDRSEFEERRSAYARLNTAARQYAQELRAYLRMLADEAIAEEDRSELTQARQAFRDLFSDAQMILPDTVLGSAIKVNESLGEAYGMVKRLELGESTARPSGNPAETIAMAREYCRVTVYDMINDLRQLMRDDLGVSRGFASGQRR